MYEEHHEAVAGSLTSKGGEAGFTYEKLSRTSPDPAEKREEFKAKFDAYLEEVKDGDEDLDIAYFVDRIEMNFAAAVPVVT